MMIKHWFEQVLEMVIEEVYEGEAEHGEFNSLHEAFAVLHEEFDEFKTEVWKKKGLKRSVAASNEVRQVAAVALRIAYMLYADEDGRF